MAAEGASEVGDQLAYAVMLAASPYRSAMVAVLLWALGLGPWPAGIGGSPSPKRARAASGPGRWRATPRPLCQRSFARRGGDSYMAARA